MSELDVKNVVKSVREDAFQELLDYANAAENETVKGRNRGSRENFMSMANVIALNSDILDRFRDAERLRNVAHYRALDGRFDIVKKVIRKCTAFQFRPVIEDQNKFNDNVVVLLDSLIQVVNRQQQVINELEDRIALLEKHEDTGMQ